MGLFGFGKKKNKVDPEKMARDAARNMENTVADMDFNALLKAKEEEDKKNALELTEENLLRVISEHSGHPATMSSTLGSLYDFSEPMMEVFIAGDLGQKFGIDVPDVLTENTTVSEVLEIMKDC